MNRDLVFYVNLKLEDANKTSLLWVERVTSKCVHPLYTSLTKFNIVSLAY